MVACFHTSCHLYKGAAECNEEVGYNDGKSWRGGGLGCEALFCVSLSRERDNIRLSWDYKRCEAALILRQILQNRLAM